MENKNYKDKECRRDCKRKELEGERKLTGIGEEVREIILEEDILEKVGVTKEEKI